MVSNGNAQFRRGPSVEWWLTTVLALAAAITVGFGLALLIGREDSEALESPLLLAVAHQLHAGPWELYGPYDAGNHLVLIHAPFYYHLSALLAWPLARFGVDSLTASLFAGRSLSLLGLVVTAALGYRLARRDGAPAAVGVWAALLFAGAPVLASVPYAVRPDLLGIAFQTAGVLLVLGTLLDERRPGWRLLAAYLMFALAFCTKQHFVVAAAISTGLLMSAVRRRRVAFKGFERALLLGLAVVLAVFGTEELLTGGRMSQAVFLAARSASAIHPGSWYRVGIVFLAAVLGTEGLLTLLAAAGFAMLWRDRGCVPSALRAAGASLIGLVLMLVTAQILIDSHRLTIAVVGTITLFLPCWVAAFVFQGRRERIGERLDGLLWLYFLGEMAVLVMLFRASTGAWVNYAIQAVVFLAILTGRALGRLLKNRPPFALQAVVVAAALVCLVSAVFAVRNAEHRRRIDREAIEILLDRERCAPSAVFVADHPGMNRLHGRLDLVYDEWLYPVFEEIGLAQPRAIWLGQILAAGNVQYVVNNTDDSLLDGVVQPLRELGFFPKYKIGPFYVWEKPARSRMK